MNPDCKSSNLRSQWKDYAIVEGLPNVVWFQHHLGTHSKFKFWVPSPWIRTSRGPAGNLCFTRWSRCPPSLRTTALIHSFMEQLWIEGVSCPRRTHLWAGVQVPSRSLQSRKRTWTSKISNNQKISEARKCMSTLKGLTLAKINRKVPWGSGIWDAFCSKNKSCLVKAHSCGRLKKALVAGEQ